MFFSKPNTFLTFSTCNR